MDYRELSQAEYDRKLRLVVAGAEGLHAHAQNIGDGMATIGWGYTFNRNNNVEIWRESGINLTQEQWLTLATIDAAATNAEKTRVGLAFTRELDATESDSLLRASFSEYEEPANILAMPLSDERVALVSLAYNRGVGNLSGSQQRNVPEHPVLDAIRSGDRAEVWFQMRYNCWGSDKLDEQYPDADSNEAGLRKRRFAEAEVFGLYDDPGNVTPQQAREVYRAFQLHREEVDRVEREFGVTVEGDAARRNRIAQANRDYPELVNEYGRVSTIADALAPARTALLQDLRRQYPELSDRLTDANFNAGRIHLDPGRDLQDAEAVDRDHPGNNRTQNAVRREQRNTTAEEVDQNHAATLDSRRMQGNVEIASNDLLIGDGGNDTLRSHRGDDILIGGHGRDRMEGGEGRDTYVVDAGDSVMDGDGAGEVRWGGLALTGGARAASDPVDIYRSEDGRFIYALDDNTLSVTDTLASDPGLRGPVVVENFQNGQLGITLGGPQTDPHRPEGQRHGQGPGSAVPPGPASASDVEDRRSGRGPERGPFNDPFVNKAYAALLAGDGRELDRVAREFSQSPEGQRMAQMGDQWLAQQQRVDEQQRSQTHQGPAMRM
nr:hemolysin [uncultured Pseudoxanthomonas sp.]